MHRRPRYLPWLAIALVAIGQMLTACGQRGPLYLPEPPAVEGTASQPPAAEEKSESEEAAR